MYPCECNEENQHYLHYFFFFSSRRRHTRWPRDWSSDVCSSDLTSSGEACRRRNREPWRLSATASLASASIVAALGWTPLRSQTRACIPVSVRRELGTKFIGGKTDEFSVVGRSKGS